jgi:hypothetical protein
MNPAQPVIDMLEKIEAAINKLQDFINKTLNLVPGFLGWIVDKVRDGWNSLVAKIEEFWDWFTDKLSYVGDPIALSNAASSWKVDIGGKVGNLARDIDDSDILVDDRWQGAGADQYRQAIPPQRDAMLSIKTDFANNIATGLESLRTAIVVFWGAVLAAIIGISVAFAVATGEAVTVFGLPLAPPTALGGLAVGLGAIGVAALNLQNVASGAKSSFETAAGGVQTWPTFVTA